MANKAAAAVTPARLSARAGGDASRARASRSRTALRRESVSSIAASLRALDAPRQVSSRLASPRRQPR